VKGGGHRWAGEDGAEPAPEESRGELEGDHYEKRLRQEIGPDGRVGERKLRVEEEKVRTSVEEVEERKGHAGRHV
jgi:hypothetical protein